MCHSAALIMGVCVCVCGVLGASNGVPLFILFIFIFGGCFAAEVGPARSSDAADKTGAAESQYGQGGIAQPECECVFSWVGGWMGANRLMEDKGCPLWGMGTREGSSHVSLVGGETEGGCRQEASVSLLGRGEGWKGPPVARQVLNLHPRAPARGLPTMVLTLCSNLASPG